MSFYSKIKNLAIALIPRSVLFNYELVFRYPLYLKHKGDKYQCSVCGSGLDSFIPIREDRMCPRCGALERHRRLFSILKNEFLRDDIKVLDFSPARALYRAMKKLNIKYISSDLSGDFIAEVAFDIKSIDSPKENFDLIICYHVLEHIDDDFKAISELHRVLKPGAFCIIQTPFKDGEIYENSSVITPEDRTKHFGQCDHLRIYSAAGLAKRLEESGFRVDVRNFDIPCENHNALSPKETILVCKKS
jgi:SAM-dependent methyltransferase